MIAITKKIFSEKKTEERKSGPFLIALSAVVLGLAAGGLLMLFIGGKSV